MGYASVAQCFTTQFQASQNYCALKYPIEGVSGSILYTWTCAPRNSGGGLSDGLTLTRSQSGSSTLTSQILYVSYPACDELEKYADMSTLWGLLVAAAAVVWITKRFFWRLLANQ